jgi:hypothetical protein
MANNILIVEGTAIVVADATYDPTAARTLGAITDDIDCAGLTSGQARESDKIDLLEFRAPSYRVLVATELETDPVAGGSIDLYWSPSHSASPNVGNAGGALGADGDFAGYDTLTLAEALLQMDVIGSLLCGINDDEDGVQIGRAGVWTPSSRYGVLIVHNNTSIVLNDDSIEMAVGFYPIIPQIQ